MNGINGTTVAVTLNREKPHRVHMYIALSLGRMRTCGLRHPALWQPSSFFPLTQEFRFRDRKILQFFYPSSFINYVDYRDNISFNSKARILNCSWHSLMTTSNFFWHRETLRDYRLRLRDWLWLLMLSLSVINMILYRVNFTYLLWFISGLMYMYSFSSSCKRSEEAHSVTY